MRCMLGEQLAKIIGQFCRSHNAVLGLDSPSQQDTREAEIMRMLKAFLFIYF